MHIHVYTLFTHVAISPKMFGRELQVKSGQTLATNALNAGTVYSPKRLVLPWSWNRLEWNRMCYMATYTARYAIIIYLKNLPIFTIGIIVQ